MITSLYGISNDGDGYFGSGGASDVEYNVGDNYNGGSSFDGSANGGVMPLRYYTSFTFGGSGSRDHFILFEATTTMLVAMSISMVI